jgi:TPP-dependent pyruvate/acetoin dehydrogenase alpha subunit
MRRDMIERKISTALVENIARIVDRGRLLVLLITPYIKYKSYKKQFKECCDKLYQSAEDINNYINDDTIDKVFNTIIDKNILTEYVLEYSDIVAEIAGIFDDSINEIESKKSERKSKNESREIDNE